MRARGAGQSAGTSALRLMKHLDERSVRSSNLLNVESPPSKHGARSSLLFLLQRVRVED